MMIRKLLLLLVFSTLLIQISVADSSDSTPVGPGIIHHHELREAGPWQINVLEIDLTNTWLKIESIKASNQIVGRETTSAMAIESDREAHRVVGAINADFFEIDGTPVGAQIVNGILLKRPYPRSVFAVSNLMQPILDIVSFKGALVTSKNLARSINGINEARATDELIIYNKYAGPRTGTNYWGTEIAAKYLTEHPMVNDTIFVVAVAKDSIMAEGHGDNIIPTDGVIISGHGTSSTFLTNNIFVGDTLSFILQLPPTTQSIIELIGGTPRLIRDGVVSVEWEKEKVGRSFVYDRHPRTAVGFNQDSTKLYFFTVDGRQPGYSVGMSLFELAEYMLGWNVYQGVNLDGGGSTTMIVRGKVVNRPSDATGERSVANALMVISIAPTGLLSLLKISPQQVYILAGNQFQFSVKGFDQYFNPVSISPGSLEWNCDGQIGSISNNGLFTAAEKQDSGFVYIAYGSIRDSACVYITRVASIELLPNPVILKVGENQTISPSATDEYKNVIALAPAAYQWSVAGEISTISNDGIFSATQQDQGQVIASYQSVAGSTPVFVDFASDVVIDNFTTTSNWSLSGVLVNLSGSRFQTDNLVLYLPLLGKVGI